MRSINTVLFLGTLAFTSALLAQDETQTLEAQAIAQQAPERATAMAATPAQRDAKIERTLKRMQALRAIGTAQVTGDFRMKPSFDTTAPTSMLRAIIADLKRLSPIRRAAPRAKVQAAQRLYGSSLRKAGASPSDRAGALADLRAANNALNDAKASAGPGHRRKLNAIFQKGKAAASRLARGLDSPAATTRTPSSDGQASGSISGLATQDATTQSSAPFGPSNKLAADVITFDIDEFEQNLIDGLAGKTVGYAYSIGLNGQAHSAGEFGDARTAADGQTAQSPNKEMFTASMSKTITAVAMQRVLKDKGISINTPIAGFLPDDWAQGPKLGEVTFKRLMKHRSGLDIVTAPASPISCCAPSGQTVASLKTIIAAGSTGSADADQHIYTNANYSLMRILIPRIAYEPGVIQNWANVWPLEDVWAALYAIYVDQNVLSPAGISKTGCFSSQSDATRTLYYDMTSPGDDGLDPGDWTLSCGAAGWYLSAVELGSFLAHLRFTNDIIDNQTRQQMDDLFLGWLDPGVFSGHVSGAFGDYRGHGGDYAGTTSCMINFHINVQASLIVNSEKGGFPTHVCRTLKEAFDNAWE
jgi:CubicO group peptidase (beta-lactamase class C family)